MSKIPNYPFKEGFFFDPLLIPAIRYSPPLFIPSYSNLYSTDCALLYFLLHTFLFCLLCPLLNLPFYTLSVLPYCSLLSLLFLFYPTVAYSLLFLFYCSLLSSLPSFYLLLSSLHAPLQPIMSLRALALA